MGAKDISKIFRMSVDEFTEKYGYPRFIYQETNTLFYEGFTVYANAHNRIVKIEFNGTK